MTKEVRLRFAPSPTGYLHVGGLRSALYNYLFAKKNNGKLILRIEDTDRTRFVEDSVENLIKSLEWVGIEFDEGPSNGGNFGPYYQSQRTSIYQEHAQILEEKGFAYKCFCSPEELEERRNEQVAAKKQPIYDRRCRHLTQEEIEKNIKNGKKYTIRLKIPLNQDNIVFEDLIYGKISFISENIDDQVLLKADGFPTYHLANVVDDHFMKISHVIRGEEWVPSTPKHVIMYKAFGWDLPKFAHLPLLVNSERKKLSKRHGDVSVQSFQEKGYLKEALVNFVSFLGWHPTDNQEIFSLNQLIKEFSLERVNKSSAIFDYAKLDWFNSEYLKLLSDQEIADKCLKYLKDSSIDLQSEIYKKIISASRGGMNKLSDIKENIKIFTDQDLTFENEDAEAMIKEDSSQEVFKAYLDFLTDPTYEYSPESAVKLISKTGKKTSVKGKKLWMPIRIALTGQNHGPELDKIIDIFGKEKTINRIKLVII